MRKITFRFSNFADLSAIMTDENRVMCKNSDSTQTLLEQAFPCSGDGTALNPLGDGLSNGINLEKSNL